MSEILSLWDGLFAHHESNEMDVIYDQAALLAPRLASTATGGTGSAMRLGDAVHPSSHGRHGRPRPSHCTLACSKWRCDSRACLSERSDHFGVSKEERLLNATTSQVLLQRCDLSERRSAAARRNCSEHSEAEAPLRGVWHIGGVLSDCLFSRQDAMSLRHVYGPKANGASTLQAATFAAPLQSCVLFSSIVALLGGAGQANYSAANSSLDALATMRCANGEVGLSLQWGPWAEFGMASRGAAAKRVAGMAASGFRFLSPANGLRMLEHVGRYSLLR